MCYCTNATNCTKCRRKWEHRRTFQKLIKDYAKDHEALEVKALSIGGELIAADQIDRVAKLPTLDEARAMLMSVMLAPITKLARTMNEVPAQVTRAVAAVRDQKQAEG